MNNKDYNIFFVEDDPNFGSVLKSYLELQNFNVNWITDGKQALKCFIAANYHLAILDVMLPYTDGLQIATRIKTSSPEFPILFLTAKGQKKDILEGFKTGADDYLVKPFDSDILILKIKALLNRALGASTENQKKISIGTFEFDYNLRLLTNKESTIKLSPKETELLLLLSQSRNRILQRSKTLLKIWGNDDYFTTRSMDVVVTKLRKHLKPDPNIVIENIHGKGFMLKLN